jgi:hypothetical protein
MLRDEISERRAAEGARVPEYPGRFEHPAFLLRRPLQLAYVYFGMSRAAAPGAAGGGGEPPAAASHVSETVIQDLPERRRPRVTAAQCTE